jgi:hypothetical protein
VIILALDLAGVTGVAVGAPGGAPTAWSVDLGKSRSEDARFSKALVLTHKLIETHKPDLIAIEAPVGGPKTSHFLVGLVACVRGCAFNRKVRVEAYNIASIRKHFCGGHVTSAAYGHLEPKRRKAAARAAGKNLVMQRCRQLGWQADDDNAADAAALWDYACALASRSHQLTSIPGLFEVPV